MNAAQWQRVRTLFEGALDRPPADAQAWIRSEAGDDPEVAAEAASLLEHHSRAGEFLSRPIADRAADLFEEEARFEPGSVIGSYTIVRELGRGGMGRVYEATDNRLHRTVALKALLPSLTRDPAQRERLRREARAAAVLTHPGICTIYALEEVNGDVFIASEFVDGDSLREEIAAGRQPSAGAVVDVARALADALASAHAKGITHRDLKPENVMRTRDGRLKILDFGLALMNPSAAGGSPRMTQPGTIVGTPAYMAPEQLTNGTIDPRTDLFALGVLLYEYASGVHPFDGDTTLARLARILESEPRSIAEFRPELSDAVVRVITRCLRKDPMERFASASEIVVALAASPAASGPAPSRVAVWWRNHQAIALTLYFVASALAWQVKEWQHGLPDSLFLVVAVLATIVGIFRGHLLFTERMNPAAFDAERMRARPITLIVDLSIASVLAIEGWRLASIRPLAGTLTVALGVGIALTRILVEPATTRAAFESRH